MPGLPVPCIVQQQVFCALLARLCLVLCLPLMPHSMRKFANFCKVLPAPETSFVGFVKPRMNLLLACGVISIVLCCVR